MEEVSICLVVQRCSKIRTPYARSDPAQAPRGPAVLRILHAHPHQLRTGRQRSRRGYDARLQPFLKHRKGRVAQGHRPDAARPGRRSHHPAPQLLGRALAARRRRPGCRSSMPGTACTSIPRRRFSISAPSSRICVPASRTSTTDTLAGVTVPSSATSCTAAWRDRICFCFRVWARRSCSAGLQRIAAGAGSQRRPGHHRSSATSIRRCVSRQVVMMLRIQAERLAGMQLDLAAIQSRATS